MRRAGAVGAGGTGSRQRKPTRDQLLRPRAKGEPAAGAERGPTPSVAALFELARNGEPEADETRGPTASVGAALSKAKGESAADET
jgi:hypothetical protein